MSDSSIKSFRKGQAIHRPEGWIKSHRSKVIHLLEGKMSEAEYIIFDILLHAVGWDRGRPDFGRIEKNVSRLHREWFYRWTRQHVNKVINSLESKLYICFEGEWIVIPNFEKYQSNNPQKGATHIAGGATTVAEGATYIAETATPVAPCEPETSSTTGSETPLKERRNKKEYTPLPPRGERRDPMTRFDEFWAAYPKRQGKEPARKAWVKIAPDDELIDAILKAIEAHKQTEQWRKANGQFIPMASTWLNQRRWEDEVDVPDDGGDFFKLARFGN